MRQAWTLPEQKLLTELAATHTIMQLCEKLDRSKASISNRLNTLGIQAVPSKRQKQWTIQEHNLMLSMLDDFTYEAIGKEIGRSSPSVRQHAARYHNVKPRKNMWEPTEQQKERVRVLRASGMKLAKIASTMRCTIWNIKKIVHAENLPYVYRNGTVRRDV